jgi:hypothetical protein
MPSFFLFNLGLNLPLMYLNKWIKVMYKSAKVNKFFSHFPDVLPRSYH